ncbi:MAG: hypothetical protein ABSH47_27880 [Bryobacteraceae bacterium]
MWISIDEEPGDDEPAEKPELTTDFDRAISRINELTETRLLAPMIARKVFLGFAKGNSARELWIILISSIWPVVALATVAYGFFYPQYHLGRIVRAAWTRQLEDMQGAARPYSMRLGHLTDEDWKQVDALTDIQTQLLAAGRSTLDWRTIGAFVTTFLLPVASYVLGMLGVLPQHK